MRVPIGRSLSTRCSACPSHLPCSRFHYRPLTTHRLQEGSYFPLKNSHPAP